MNIYIVGGGSIGLLLAGRLTEAAENIHQVKMICRKAAQASEILRSGITVNYSEEGEHFTVFPAAASFEGWEKHREAEKPDWILLAVKQKDIDDDLAAWLAHWSGSHTGIVCFQNGLGHEERLALHLPRSSIYMAVTTEGARKSSPTEVRHTGKGITRIGRAYGFPKACAGHAAGHGDREQALLQFLCQAGFDARWTDHIHRYGWNKLVINSIINPLTALTGIPNGELIRNQHLLQLAQSLFAEAKEVAGRRGIELDAHLWEQVFDVCERTAANESSMLQDIYSGRTTEIDWINGSLVRIAEEEGLELPTHQTLYHLIKSMENGRNSR
ncbi:ketopantoate reductase family protein [Paenibacillus sp. J2TS4]|uniref:ketopantoate reductase family protein n=1 Tax=Paenibacillus sp. J2TS4 TaxID=2807194 RepID=UPI001B0EDE1B|nr:2-dehydropantoate 2-reductase [Paenibacillus sp. J2TS4]GIP36379.1 2-dehydropantoate 2-reductase [Paenibacillus sp. J2TS4]